MESQLRTIVREWMARHPYDSQGPTFGEDNLVELAVAGTDAIRAPSRRMFITYEAGKQWGAARTRVEMKRSSGVSTPITNNVVAAEAVSIATALADALKLEE